MRHRKTYSLNGYQRTMSTQDTERSCCGCFIKWRKWLPPPLRKLSQGKNDKAAPTGSVPVTASTTAADRPNQLKKTPLDKKFKLPLGGERTSLSEDADVASSTAGTSSTSAIPLQTALDECEDDVPEVELPPPMKPIQDPQAVLQSPSAPAGITSSQPPRGSALTLDTLESSSSAPADIAEIEQIVKERMEQHGGAVGTPVTPAVRQADFVPSELIEPPVLSSAPCEEESTSDNDSVEAALKKCEFVLRELVDTEEKYVADLRLVCEGYMTHMRDPAAEPPLPEELKDGRDKMVFGNIEAIYEWHRDFLLRELRRCISQPEHLGPLFRRSERKLHMYVVYCQNKPVSEYIVSKYIDTFFEELRQKLGHKLQICDLLIKPVQRIQKYHLLVGDALRHAERGGAPANVVTALRDAASVTSVVPKSANDMMDVGRLEGFDGKITAQGRLLLHGVLNCTDITNLSDKPKDLHVFLFEQSIIFSEAVGKKTQFTSPSYHYKAHIQVNKMVLEEHSSSGSFTVRSTHPRGAPVAFTCRTATATCQKWISKLTSILQTQRDFLKAIQSPIVYQKELTKKPSDYGSESSTSWSPGLRKTASVPPQNTWEETTVSGQSAPSRQKVHVKANTINLPSSAFTAQPLSNVEKPLNLVLPVVSDGLQSSTETNGGSGKVGVTSRKLWALRIRKGTPLQTDFGTEGCVTELHAPELIENLKDTAITPGSTITLSCKIRGTREANISWRKTAPDIRVLRTGGRIATSLSETGTASLTITACRATDAGTYCCLITNELGGVQSTARLTVGETAAPGMPTAQALSAGGVAIQWNNEPNCWLEYCRLGSGEWVRIPGEASSCGNITLDELAGGAAYSFRLMATPGGPPGPPGPAVSVVPNPSCRWEQEQFCRRYVSEEELGRGRMCIAIAARDTGTGQRVALKQVFSSRGGDAAREYRRMLAAADHPNLIRALALFTNAPKPGVNTIVMELVNGPHLLEWIARNGNNYSEATAALYTKQLLSALQWLHFRHIAHLDVKPENIMVDLSGTPKLKLIDLGSSVDTECLTNALGSEVLPPAPSQLEFAPPERVLGKPPSVTWDSWASGVFIYVFLTGLSPFLDDSVEETTANIIKCDFCFPSEHWSTITEGATSLVTSLLESNEFRRLPPSTALSHSWLQDACEDVLLPTARLRAFLKRRKTYGSHS